MIIEMLGKIIICLIAALLLGFLVGWLFSQALISEKKETPKKKDVIKNNSGGKLTFEELEAKYEEQIALVAEAESKNRELKGELLKKMSILQTTSNTLKEIQASEKDGSRVAVLEQRLAQKEAELLEFETVLVKAEETIAKLRKQN